MKSINQKTLKNSVCIEGVGVHSGEKVSLTLKPAPVNTGMVFKRIDCVPCVEIPALSAYVGETLFCTALIKEGVKISTVEHLLSAMRGLDIDNAIIEVSAAELPIMDGSASAFVFLIQSAGFVEQSAAKQFLKIKHCIEFQEGDKWVKIEPYDGFNVSFVLDYDHPMIQKAKSFTFEFSTAAYIKEVSRARTFGFLSDFESLKSNNLALGGGLHNAVVLDETGIINTDGLRYRDEFARHKILDVVGDLFLLGFSVLGKFSAYKSGHALNNQLVMKILANPASWDLVHCPE